MKGKNHANICLNPSSTKSVLLLALQVAKSQDWSLKQSRLKQLYLRFAPDMVIFRERLFQAGNGLRRLTVFGLTILSLPVMAGIVLVGAAISVVTGFICPIILNSSGCISRQITNIRTRKTSNPSLKEVLRPANSLTIGDFYSTPSKVSATRTKSKKRAYSQCSLNISNPSQERR